jgi:hypothetical protein
MNSTILILAGLMVIAAFSTAHVDSGFGVETELDKEKEKGEETTKTIFTKQEKKCVSKISEADKTKATTNALVKCREDFRKKPNVDKIAFRKCVASLPQVKACF